MGKLNKSFLRNDFSALPFYRCRTLPAFYSHRSDEGEILRSCSHTFSTAELGDHRLLPRSLLRCFELLASRTRRKVLVGWIHRCRLSVDVRAHLHSELLFGAYRCSMWFLQSKFYLASSWHLQFQWRFYRFHQLRELLRLLLVGDIFQQFGRRDCIFDVQRVDQCMDDSWVVQSLLCRCGFGIFVPEIRKWGWWGSGRRVRLRIWSFFRKTQCWQQHRWYRLVCLTCLFQLAAWSRSMGPWNLWHSEIRVVCGVPSRWCPLAPEFRLCDRRWWKTFLLFPPWKISSRFLKAKSLNEVFGCILWTLTWIRLDQLERSARRLLRLGKQFIKRFIKFILWKQEKFVVNKRSKFVSFHNKVACTVTKRRFFSNGESSDCSSILKLVKKVSVCLVGFNWFAEFSRCWSSCLCLRNWTHIEDTLFFWIFRYDLDFWNGKTTVIKKICNRITESCTWKLNSMNSKKLWIKMLLKCNASIINVNDKVKIKLLAQKRKLRICFIKFIS